jgi:hypothetical protein
MLKVRRQGHPVLEPVAKVYDPVAEVRACLVVLASDDAAAERLAAGWGLVSGYRVAVLALTGPGEDAR